jgi:hypothetical protein
MRTTIVPILGLIASACASAARVRRGARSGARECHRPTRAIVRVPKNGFDVPRVAVAPVGNAKDVGIGANVWTGHRKWMRARAGALRNG